MCPQNVCPRRCIVTLIAFVQLFTTVRFQMCPQIAFLRRGIVTLVTFVWLHCAFLLHTLKFTFTFHFLMFFCNWKILIGDEKCRIWGDEMCSLGGWNVLFGWMKRYNLGGWKDTNQGGWSVLGWNELWPFKHGGSINSFVISKNTTLREEWNSMNAKFSGNKSELKQVSL